MDTALLNVSYEEGHNRECMIPSFRYMIMIGLKNAYDCYEDAALTASNCLWFEGSGGMNVGKKYESDD